MSGAGVGDAGASARARGAARTAPSIKVRRAELRSAPERSAQKTGLYPPFFIKW